MIQSSNALHGLPGKVQAYTTPWELMLGAESVWRWSRFVPAVWLATQGNRDLVNSLSRNRLAHLLDSARMHSPFYRQYYSGIAHHAALKDYPVVTRRALMDRFNDWVTNPAIRRSDVDAFIADPNRLGEPYLGRYAVWTSSGTTGRPGIYVVEPDALAIYQALLTTRLTSAEGETLPWHCLASGGQIAMIAATEGHYAGIVSWERERRLHPWISGRARAISITEPIAQIVNRLNQW